MMALVHFITRKKNLVLIEEQLKEIERRLDGFSYEYDPLMSQITQDVDERIQQHADALFLFELVRQLLKNTQGDINNG